MYLQLINTFKQDNKQTMFGYLPNGETSRKAFALELWVKKTRQG